MNLNEIHEKHMLKAVSLAERGIGSVEPNPAVGAVIVKDGKIIGKGWHRRFGRAHAEVEALRNCRKKGNDPAGATMYVTLEPCCHQGKTGPCTDAIIESKIAQVVIAVEDPAEHCRGKGIERLKQARIEVIVGPGRDQAVLLNGPFFKFAQTGKTWVILKWAQSLDGYLANAETAERWISCSQSRDDVQVLRRRAQAIMVGVTTVLEDDPLLTARPARKEPLIRCVLDSSLRTPSSCQLLRTTDQGPIMIFTTIGAAEAHPDQAQRLKQAGANVIAVPARQGRCDLEAVVEKLGDMKVQQLIIEGGATVLHSALAGGIVDEAVIYVAPVVLGAKGRKDIASAMRNLPNRTDFRHVSVTQFGIDSRIRGFLGDILA